MQIAGLRSFLELFEQGDSEDDLDKIAETGHD